MHCPKFELHPDIDRRGLRERFAQGGRLQLAPFVAEPQALALREQLRSREDWREVVNSGDRVFDIDRPTQRSMPEEARTKLDEAVNAAAQKAFQFRYETVRVPDVRADRQPENDLLHAFAEFLCEPRTLQLFRSITGFDDIDFADAQATAYRPGDFLTSHNDAVAGKNRRAAYVFGLTPGWRTEWGGLLMFHESGGDVARGLLPRFNCLNIFSVPQLHSVSSVAPFAARMRFSVTGWFRAMGKPD